ncbi:MAG: prepilin-type N-terminal cleavage/methylation domain-containing protein [Desulfuromonadales bacterium]
MRSSSDGFTLVELLVAMTIFAIGLLSIAGMQITAMRESNRSFTRDVSGNLAYGIMEEILSRDGGDPFFVDTAATGWDFDPDTVAVDPWNEDGSGTYEGTYTVAVNTVVNKIARVDITVTGQGSTSTLTGYKRLP